MKFTLIVTIIFMLVSGMAGAMKCICPAVFSPVCAANGKMYNNQCQASCAGQSVTRPGNC